MSKAKKVTPVKALQIENVDKLADTAWDNFTSQRRKTVFYKYSANEKELFVTGFKLAYKLVCDTVTIKPTNQTGGLIEKTDI